MEQLPGLPGVGVATPPLTLSFSQAYGPRVEALEQQVAEDRESIRGLVECYRRKSETLQHLAPPGRRTRGGVRLDPTRLVDAVVARRSGEARGGSWRGRRNRWTRKWGRCAGASRGRWTRWGVSCRGS